MIGRSYRSPLPGVQHEDHKTFGATGHDYIDFRSDSSGNPDSCAVATSGGKTSLDPNCPIVHEQLCTAAHRLLDIYVAGKLEEQAAQLRANMAGAYACPLQ